MAVVKRAQVQQLLRRRLMYSVAGSVSEVYAPIRALGWDTAPIEVERGFIDDIRKTLERIRKTAVPAELRAELQAYTQFYNELAQLNNRIVEYYLANGYIMGEQLIRELLDLQKRAYDYMQRIQKRAVYLKVEMPKLEPLKPIPYIIFKSRRVL